MYDRPKCEFCGQFLGGEGLHKLYQGDNSEVDGKLIWTYGPVPEPSHDVFWHVKCEEKRYGKKASQDRPEKPQA